MIIFEDDGSPYERHPPEDHGEDDDGINAKFFNHQCRTFSLESGKDKKGWIDTSP